MKEIEIENVVCRSIISQDSALKNVSISARSLLDLLWCVPFGIAFIAMKWSLGFWRGNRSSTNNEALKETQKHLALESPLCQVPLSKWQDWAESWALSRQRSPTGKILITDIWEVWVLWLGLKRRQPWNWPKKQKWQFLPSLLVMYTWDRLKYAFLKQTERGRRPSGAANLLFWTKLWLLIL